MKKLTKILKAVLWLALALLVLDAGLITFFAVYRPPIEHADAIVILGAAINTPALYNRSLEGLKLYQQGKADTLVLSGGVDYPKSMPEAQYMENVILANASSAPATILEEDSHSTYENINNTKTILPQAKSLVVVSDRYHLARAVLVARRAGFTPVYWDAPDQSYYSWPQLLFYYGREMAAIISYLPKFITG
ncbi:MAG TPA: YdcF family protein [Patescibacteria group bacterium]|nr:YdcF family protein [Patescibacteria group bacterium]